MGLYEVLIHCHCITCVVPVDDRQLSPYVEKQYVALTGRKSIVLLNKANSKMYFTHLKEGMPENIYTFLVPYVAVRQRDRVQGRHWCACVWEYRCMECIARSVGW